MLYLRKKQQPLTIVKIEKLLQKKGDYTLYLKGIL